MAVDIAEGDAVRGPVLARVIVVGVHVHDPVPETAVVADTALRAHHAAGRRDRREAIHARAPDQEAALAQASAAH